jgi:hypothetical protein
MIDGALRSAEKEHGVRCRAKFRSWRFVPRLYDILHSSCIIGDGNEEKSKGSTYENYKR